MQITDIRIRKIEKEGKMVKVSEPCPSVFLRNRIIK